jgi:hypothetical protein
VRVLTSVMLAAFLAFTAAPADAEETWRRTVQELAVARERGETCSGLLKSFGDEATQLDARLLYAEAKAGFNSFIEELLFAINVGESFDAALGTPADVERARASLEELCRLAHDNLPSQTGSKNVLADVFKGSATIVSSLIDGAVALTKMHDETDRLRRREIATRIEAQRWIDYQDVPPAL